MSYSSYNWLLAFNIFARGIILYLITLVNAMSNLSHTDNKSFVLPGQVRLVLVSNSISLMESLLDAIAIGKRHAVYRQYRGLSYILPISLDIHLRKILMVYEAMNIYGVNYLACIHKYPVKFI